MIIEKKGKTAEIKLENDITDSYSVEFIKKMNELISEDMKRFSLDFSNVSSVDSYALANMIILCDKSDLQFTFRNVKQCVMNMFVIIKLNRLVLFE